MGTQRATLDIRPAGIPDRHLSAFCPSDQLEDEPDSCQPTDSAKYFRSSGSVSQTSVTESPRRNSIHVDSVANDSAGTDESERRCSFAILLWTNETGMSQLFDTAARDIALNERDVYTFARHYAARLVELLRHPGVHLASALFLVALGVAGFDLMRMAHL
jgi:hypothetical protein